MGIIVVFQLVWGCLAFKGRLILDFSCYVEEPFELSAFIYKYMYVCIHTLNVYSCKWLFGFWFLVFT